MFTMIKITQGGMAERLKAPVLKTGNGLASFVGSNPTPTAFFRRNPCLIRGFVIGGVCRFTYELSARIHPSLIRCAQFRQAGRQAICRVSSGERGVIRPGC